MISLAMACTLPQAAHARAIVAREGIAAETKEDLAEPDIVTKSSLLQLNAITFNKNVLEESSNGVNHWIVLFCLEWFEPCEAISRPFAALADEWQEKMNTDLISTEVRFAHVDCATDRVLCNEQFVEEYPVLLHYHQRQFLTGGAVGRALDRGGIKGMMWAMQEWVAQELAPILESREEQAVQEEELSLFDWAKSMVPARRDPAVDFIVVAVALLGNAWLLLRSHDRKPDAGLAEKPVAMEPEDAAAVGRRFLPEAWAKERPGVEL